MSVQYCLIYRFIQDYHYMYIEMDFIGSDVHSFTNLKHLQHKTDIFITQLLTLRDKESTVETVESMQSRTSEKLSKSQRRQQKNN